MIRLLLCLIYINVCTSIFAQYPPYFVIGSEGFTNTDIYSLYYDETSSLLYAATDDGLFVYHGDAFVSIEAKSKQKGTSLFDVQKGNNKIYCKNLSGQLFSVSDNNTLELVYELPLDQIGLFFWYYFAQDKLWIITNNSISSFPINGQKIDFNKETRYLTDFFKNGGLIDNYSPMSFGARLATSSVEGYIDIRDGQVIFNADPSEHQGRYYFEINDRSYAVNIKGGLRDLSSGKVIAQYEYNETFIAINKNLVIGKCQTRGLHFLTPNGVIAQPLAFKEKFISAVAQSSNGTVFLGTFDNGVLVIPTLVSNEVRIAGELLTSVAVNHNRIFVSSRSGQVFEIDGNERKVLYQNRENFDKVCFSPVKVGEIPDNPEILHVPSKNITNPKDVWQINDNGIIIALYDRLVLLHNDSFDRLPKYISVNGVFKNIVLGLRFTSVAYSQAEDKIYYGNNKGFFQRDYLTGKTVEIKYNGKSISVNDLYCKGDKTWVATQEIGLLLLNDGKIQRSWDEFSSLKESNVLKLKIQGEELFVLTKAGLAVLNNGSFSYLGIQHGVINSSITDFDFTDNFLTLLYKSSVLQIPFNRQFEIKNYRVGQLYLDSITVNHKRIQSENQTRFSYDENTFIFYYEFRAIETREESKIYYKLSSLNDDWILLQEPNQGEIVFNALSDGNYSFQMKVEYNGKTSYSKIYRFTLDKPFWRKWWFVMCCILFALLLISFYYRWRLNNQEKKLEAINQVNASKITAIQSQMNPHFIFNALNSIQALVLKGDTDNSYAFINKFSHLMRRALTNSEKSNISLDEEIELLETYLELEKLRFRQDFSYSLKNTVEDEVYIPPMLIQPFVENAIIHGLLPKEGQKELQIRFKKTGKSLVCSVIDNGIGREKAKEISKRRRGNYDSFATNSIENRLNLLKEKYGENLGYKFEDRLADTGTVIGTKLVVIIPLFYTKNKKNAPFTRKML